MAIARLFVLPNRYFIFCIDVSAVANEITYNLPNWNVSIHSAVDGIFDVCMCELCIVDNSFFPSFKWYRAFYKDSMPPHFANGCTSFSFVVVKRVFSTYFVSFTVAILHIFISPRDFISAENALQLMFQLAERTLAAVVNCEIFSRILHVYQHDFALRSTS